MMIKFKQIVRDETFRPVKNDSELKKFIRDYDSAHAARLRNAGPKSPRRAAIKAAYAAWRAKMRAGIVCYY